MKSLSYSLLLGCCLATYSLNIHAKTTQLEVHNSSAQPAHLTTRIEWTSYPKIEYSNQDLVNQDRAAILRVHANVDGKVTKATIQESTGIKKLDQMLIQAVQAAEVKPYQEEDHIRPIIGYQVFQLKLTDAEDTYACQYNFNSRVWQAQNKLEKTPFKYQQQPSLEVQSVELNDHSRKVQFHFKVNAQGEVKKARITQGSGVYVLDQKVLAAVKTAKVSNKRSAKTLWLWKTKNFKDDIQFNFNECS